MRRVFELQLWRQRSGLLSLRFARGWRQVLASLVLVLFALQSYVTQTHVHLYPTGQGTAAGHMFGVQAFGFRRIPAPGKIDPFDNPATCPICQDLALAGHFTTPGSILLALPPLVAMPVAVRLEVPRFVAAVSHIWLGRAPPQN